MQRNGKAWNAWKGFTWKWENGKKGEVVLHRSNQKQFGTMKMQGPGKALFSPNFAAVRVETGKNTEAEEIGE